MPGKQRYLRSIDIPKVGAFDVGGDVSGTAAIAPPAQAAAGPPTNLLLTTAIERSAISATARIGATWYPPAGVAPSGYIVQWSLSSAFPDPGTTGMGADDEATSIGGLTPATLYYVRVAAVVATTVSEWSATASIVTASDTTPPNPPTSPAGTFINAGDLVVTWVNPASANFRDVEVSIYASSGGALLQQIFDATGRYVWTAAQNLAATSQVGDPVVWVELRARSWGGVFSTAVNTGNVTKAAPTAPGVTVDFTGIDAVYTITPPADAAGINFVADTAVTVRKIGVVGRYVYAFDQNRLDHSGTPDPVLAYSFTVLDGLNQASSATTGTATNAVPATPTITLLGGFSVLVCRVTSVAASDFQNYEYNWKRDTVLQNIELTAAAQRMRETGAAGDEGVHTWSVIVRQQDMFGQYSGYSLEPSVVLDTLTISYLRAGLIYSDSIGTALATLAVLKDGVVVSGGVSYAA